MANRFLKTCGLVGCALLLSGSYWGTPRESKDDYYFETKEYEHLTFQVEFVIIDNEEEWDKLKKEYFKKSKTRRKVRAWTQLIRDIDDDGNIVGTELCRVFIKDPKWVYQPEILGHEMAHCVWGRWHPQQNDRNTNLGNSVLSIYGRRN